MPLVGLDDLVFGGWDIFEEDCYSAAKTAGVLEQSMLEKVRPELEKIRPWPAVFDQHYVKRLDGPNVKKGKNKRDLAEQVMADIQKFKKDNNLDRLVMVWCGSTEIFMTERSAPVARELRAGLEENDPAIPSSMVYAYAAIREGIPYANAAPNLTRTFRRCRAGAASKSPLAGKDMKTGQTLIKTIIAPGLKARLIGVKGWYSTNILGNRDGEVLDEGDELSAIEVFEVGKSWSEADGDIREAIDFCTFYAQQMRRLGRPKLTNRCRVKKVIIIITRAALAS